MSKCKACGQDAIEEWSPNFGHICPMPGTMGYEAYKSREEKIDQVLKEIKNVKTALVSMGIQDNGCGHPVDKVKRKTVMAGDLEPRPIFECECGKRVEPASFRGIK